MSLKTAKVLILNAGFNFAHSGGKLNTSLTEEAKKYLESKGHEVKITNIADGYNIEEEVSKIMWSNVVILQTPGWWMGLPWGAKKYIDEVFAHGVMYRNDGRTRKDPSKKYGSGGLCQGRYIMISSTWNAPEESFDDPSQFFEGRHAEGVWFNVYKAFEFCGFEKLKPVTFHDVMKMPDFSKYIDLLHQHLDNVFI